MNDHLEMLVNDMQRDLGLAQMRLQKQEAVLSELVNRFTRLETMVLTMVEELETLGVGEGMGAEAKVVEGGADG